MVPILLPVETMVRELDFRLAFAGLYARRHHRIFLGQSLTIHRLAREMNGAIVTGHHLMYPTAQNPLAYHEAKRAGARVVHLGEEGAVFPSDEEGLRRNLLYQLEPSLFGADDFVCAWGDLQRDFFRREAKNPENVRTTGHPRFDLCRERWHGLYRDDAARLRQRLGKFVLVNSNFSWVTNPEGITNTFSKVFAYDVEDETKRLSFVGAWSHVAKTLPAYVELVHKLAVMRPDVNFVLRPHPTDDSAWFDAVFAGVENIKVLREGVIAPWLLACSVVLHDGCTTGIEAHLFGRPLINYVPFPDPERENYLPNVIGHRCVDEASAIEAVLGALEGEDVGLSTEYPDLALRMFETFRSESFPKFIDVMQEAETTSVRSRGIDERRLRVGEALATGVERGKRLLRPLSPRRLHTARMARVKFGGFDREIIGRRLQAIEAITNNPLTATYHSPTLVELRSSRS